jgi:hypothetical protein
MACPQGEEGESETGQINPNSPNESPATAQDIDSLSYVYLLRALLYKYTDSLQSSENNFI